MMVGATYASGASAMRRARPRQSFNAVLNACLKSSGCAAAEQWLQKMRQAASVTEPGGSPLPKATPPKNNDFQ